MRVQGEQTTEAGRYALDRGPNHLFSSVMRMGAAVVFDVSMLSVNLDGPVAVQVQIQNQIRYTIASGRLEEGDPSPPCAAYRMRLASIRIPSRKRIATLSSSGSSLPEEASEPGARKARESVVVHPSRKK